MIIEASSEVEYDFACLMIVDVDIGRLCFIFCLNG